jgi:large subunit ribosomal protein L10
MATKEQKQQRVDTLRTQMAEAPFVALVDYTNITVAQVNDLRRSFETDGIIYKVEKNTLINLAVQGTDKEGIQKYLGGMVGVVISGEDGIACAKKLKEVAASFKGETFKVKGGYFDGEALDAASTLKVAELPSKEELLSTLLRTIQEGPRQVLGVI